MRIVYFRDDTFSLEYVIDKDKNYCMHCDVFEWKLSTLKKIYREFASFLSMSEGKLVYTISPNPRFVKMFGGETISILNKDGKEYEVIIWEWTPSQSQQSL